MRFYPKHIGLVIIAIISTALDIYSKEFPADSIIESFIITNKINNKTLLINFGPDAVTAIKTQKGIVVIDAGISTYLTGKYREVIEDEFHRNDFAYVINTHGHHDHYRGNSVFPEAQVIAQKNALQEISDQWKEPARVADRMKEIADDYESKLHEFTSGSPDWNENFIQYCRCYYAWLDAKNSVPVKQPDITFTDSLMLNMGDLTFEMKYFGKCHSGSDILVFVPDLKLLFTGDLFSRYGRPGINDVSMAERGRWQESTAWITERLGQIDTVIGGHGQILGREDLESFMDLLYK